MAKNKLAEVPTGRRPTVVDGRLATRLGIAPTSTVTAPGSSGQWQPLVALRVPAVSPTRGRNPSRRRLY